MKESDTTDTYLFTPSIGKYLQIDIPLDIDDRLTDFMKGFQDGTGVLYLHIVHLMDQHNMSRDEVMDYLEKFIRDA